ncbi:SUKH-4 immunity protein of toxin-antitoxin system [Actinocrispum wychmicini]|uniref:SUKH-4 immunity protein of toxin-antitoxin system n=1 Tax=Actinocrispum wychmicini TaxID=1213861 RepID=A0A4R2IJN8_9PSEU|nr:SUKH-4 immunity protein of toxin-antitoxin system [Actinocrispum wychmicini]
MPVVTERLTAVMAAGLDELVADDHRIRLPTQAARRWDIPGHGQIALSRWGLPVDQLLVPGFQSETHPILVPNVAGENERRVIAPHQRLYVIGRWGRHESAAKIGAVAGDGRVLALWDSPLAVDDVHPDLAEHYRDLYRPAVEFVNSSVAQFVECCWRWRAAVEVLVADLEAYDPTWPTEAALAHCDLHESGKQIVMDQFRQIDPGIDGPATIWGETVLDELV